MPPAARGCPHAKVSPPGCPSGRETCFVGPARSLTPMPAYETIDLEVRDGVAHLTLNRPDAANGINLPLAQDLMDATLAIAADPDGPGGAAHRRRGAVLRRRRPQGVRRSRRPPHPPPRDPRPAARRDRPAGAGRRAGGGGGAGQRGRRRASGLVGASDLVLAGESAKFVMAYTGVGLTPDGSSSWFLPRLVGLRRALELTFTNRVLSAAEAKEWGLITDVVPDDQLAAEAEALAAQARRGPAAGVGARRSDCSTPASNRRSSRTSPARPRRSRRRRAPPEGGEGIAAFVGEARRRCSTPTEPSLESAASFSRTVASSAARCSSSWARKRVVARAEDADREQPGVARLADADRRHRDAVGHLHDGEQRVEAVELLQRYRHADHRQRRHRRGHAREGARHRPHPR